MINPPLHVKIVFREQVEKCLRATFNENTMENVRDVMENKDTCVIALIFFYESKGTPPQKVYRVLSCLLYYLIEKIFLH